MNDLEKKFVSLLQTAHELRASDIHLMTGCPPALRASSGLVEAQIPPFSAEEINAICQFMVTDPKLKAQFNDLSDIDGSFEIKGIGRFRFNIYKNVQGRAAVLRVINTEVPTIESLKLPAVLAKIADAPRGLVLVTGATGSGKTSTLAAMIDYLNENHALHILTIEDPIEFLHQRKKSRISQREIGKDTPSFAQALRSALRQDPDVILVGEMRDFETLDIALKAAETGHLVFSTVHTSDAMKTIGRLISLFPPEEQQSARIRLSDNLHAIISQRLVPTQSGSKAVAQEILINNVGIADCILNEKRTNEIPTFIGKGREVSGMQTFDQHLAEMVQSAVIDLETALAYASNPSDFQRNISFHNSSSSLIPAVNKGLEMDEGNDLAEGLSVEGTPSGIDIGLDRQVDSAPPMPAMPAMPAKPGELSKADSSKPVDVTKTGFPKIPKIPGAA